MRNAGIAFSAVLLILVSCKFPDPEIVPDDGQASSSSSSGAASSSSSGGGGDDGGDASPDGPGPCLGSDPVCDCDGDGQKKKGDCGGQDCNDTEAQAFQGQTMFVTRKPLGDFDGDWNCDNSVDHQHESIECSTLLTSLLCDGEKGFKGARPGCGETGTFVTCSWTGTACVETMVKLEVQGCL